MTANLDNRQLARQTDQQALRIIDQAIEGWTEAQWCQGAKARDVGGNPVSTHDPQAVAWCAVGRLEHAAGPMLTPDENRAMTRAWQMICQGIEADHNSLSYYADAPERSFEEIIDLYQQAYSRLDYELTMPLAPERES